MKTTEYELKLYKKSLELWGTQGQLDMLIEEMSELTQAILKARRRSMTTFTENLHEEFVDVSIVMAQIETLLDARKLIYWKEEKLARIDKRQRETPELS